VLAFRTVTYCTENEETPLYGKIDIQDGVVQQSNFPSYPMVKLAEAPVVETWIVPSTRAPGGVGEPGVPPIAPAVSNALFALTGKRQRAFALGVADRVVTWGALCGAPTAR
jgi:hypothetical protein